MKNPSSLNRAVVCTVIMGLANLCQAAYFASLGEVGPFRNFPAILGACGLLECLAAVLLHQRNRYGLVLWLACAPLQVMQFPVGTVLTVVGLGYLRRPAVLDLIWRRNPEVVA